VTRKEIMEVTESKAFYREKYGLPQDRFTVMIAAGGYGKSGMSRVVKALVKHVKYPITLVAICGTNKRLYQKLQRMKDTVQTKVDIRPYEFVDKVYELNRAADVFLTKGGPNAMLDSALMGVPVGVYYFASNIEYVSTYLFTDVLNCGRSFYQSWRIVKWINECVSDPTILDIYIHGANKVRQDGNGAVQIAQFIQGYE
jgi:UDP-N-acetylglucosamine:LPS N-acetylglucosamine transferase